VTKKRWLRHLGKEMQKVIRKQMRWRLGLSWRWEKVTGWQRPTGKHLHSVIETVR
jgi:hypothetical protein